MFASTGASSCLLNPFRFASDHKPKIQRLTPITTTREELQFPRVRRLASFSSKLADASFIDAGFVLDRHLLGPRNVLQHLYYFERVVYKDPDARQPALANAKLRL